MQKQIDDLWTEVNNYCRKNKLEGPNWGWLAVICYRLLRQYPGGVSVPVIHTELESKWRLSRRRGDNFGLLKQIIARRRITNTDIIIGQMKKVDSLRFNFATDDCSINALMDRRFADWVSFTNHVGCSNFLESRKARLTRNRLLKGNPLLLLPSGLVIFELSLGEASDENLIQGVLADIHSRFLLQIGGKNDDVLGLFAEAIETGPIEMYPSRNHAQQFRIVRLKVHPRRSLTFLNTSQSSFQNSNFGSSEEGFTLFLVLYDDQVELTSLWEDGDILYFHRPYLCPNQDEPLLFGGNESSGQEEGKSNGSMKYSVHHRPHSMIEKHLTSSMQQHKICPNFHLNYGTITCCCLVRSPIRTVSLVSTSGSKRTINGNPSTEYPSLSVDSEHGSKDVDECLSNTTQITIPNEILRFYESMYQELTPSLGVLVDDEDVSKELMITKNDSDEFDMSKLHKPIDPLKLLPKMTRVTLLAVVLGTTTPSSTENDPKRSCLADASSNSMEERLNESTRFDKPPESTLWLASVRPSHCSGDLGPMLAISCNLRVLGNEFLPGHTVLVCNLSVLKPNIFYTSKGVRSICWTCVVEGACMESWQQGSQLAITNGGCSSIFLWNRLLALPNSVNTQNPAIKLLDILDIYTRKQKNSKSRSYGGPHIIRAVISKYLPLDDFPKNSYHEVQRPNPLKRYRESSDSEGAVTTPLYLVIISDGSFSIPSLLVNEFILCTLKQAADSIPPKEVNLTVSYVGSIVDGPYEGVLRRNKRELKDFLTSSLQRCEHNDIMPLFRIDTVVEVM